MTATPAEDARWMAAALRLARRGLYSTDPNPRVGCVLVRDGGLVGEGWHERAGGPHAETHALRAAGEAARGATAYVNLEPCSHHGRTPPCSNALIEAGVSRVVCAMQDPNPQVAGGGIAALRAAGIEVSCGVLEEDAARLNAGFVKRVRTGLPWLRLKLAASLDGRSAMADGESRWITSSAARDDVQHWRARSGAVMVGSGTLRADDPRLDVRRADLVERCVQPLRVVLDSRLSLRSDARLLGGDGRAVVFCAVAAASRPDLAARVESVPGDDGRCDLRDALQRLGELGANEVLAEPGATLAGALVQAGLVDEFLLYVAPRLLGADARGLLDLHGVTRLAQAPALRWLDARAVGPDLRLRAVPV